MNKKIIFNREIKEYIMTIIVSMVMVFAICFCVQFELMYRSEQTVNFNELNVQNLSKFWTIEELEKQLAKTPDDYFLNVRLAVLYESLNKLEKANEFHKNALKLSSRSNFSLYSYAMFCARNDLFVFAATLAEELTGSNKQTNMYKAKIYEQLGISFDKKNNIPASVSSFQIAYKYAKSVGDSKYLKTIKTLYAQEYVKLADINIKNKDYLQAMSDLKNSLQIKNTAIANYKLGLLYLEGNPYKAEKHIHEAFKLDVFVVNPYVYNSLLQKLLNESQMLKKQGLYNFYNSRMSGFKNKVANSYLYKNEVLVDNSTLVYKKSFWNKVKHVLVFDLKNNTKDDIKSLFLKAELFINGKKYVIEKKVINPTSFLPAFDMIRYEDFVIEDNIEFSNLNENNDIFVRYFAKRCKEAPWILLKIDFLNI